MNTPSISKYSGLFGNRTFPEKQKIYGVVEREALAIVYGITPSIPKYSGLFRNRTFPKKRKISPESEKNVHYFEIHISGVN